MREHHYGRSRGRGPRHRHHSTPSPNADKVKGWLHGRLPDDWFTEPPELVIDRDEITIIGRLAEPDYSEGASGEEQAATRSGRIQKFREDTREQRIKVALELEAVSGRKVAWCARTGDTEELFTTMSVPVMTRLRQPDRQVLDTLVDAGVARSRSDALAWCVQLVAEHTDDWLTEIREALAKVEEVRDRGPTQSSSTDESAD
jgi:hypothetical protein